jgi:hypothetical protein
MTVIGLELESHHMPHAQITIGEYTIPLLLVPESAVEDTCDLCGGTFHIQALEFVGGEIVCLKCKKLFGSPVLRKVVM